MRDEAGPVFGERLQNRVVRSQVRGFTLGVDVGARGEWIERAILPANMKEHQFRAVLELEAEPIPADLVGFELMSEEFVIHPGETRNFEAFTVYFEGSGGRQAGQRNVVGGVACSFGFLADAVFALDDGRLFRMQR